MLPGSATILSKKTGATEVTLGQLETFTSYYVKVAAYTQQGDGVKTEKLICTTAQDGEGQYLVIIILPDAQYRLILHSLIAHLF